MEHAFGADLGGVRVHSGEGAHALNRSLQAKAFTTGQDIFFREGEYSPGSSGGQELIAHELTHVMQQTHVARKKADSKKQTHGDRSGNRGQGNKEADEKEVEIHRHPRGESALQAKFGFELEFSIAVEEETAPGVYAHPPYKLGTGATLDVHRDHTKHIDKDVVAPTALATEGAEKGLPAIIELVSKPIDEFAPDAAEKLEAHKKEIRLIAEDLEMAVGEREPLADLVGPGAGANIVVGGKKYGLQQAEQAWLQATYGIKVDRIAAAFKRQYALMKGKKSFEGQVTGLVRQGREVGQEVYALARKRFPWWQWKTTGGGRRPGRWTDGEGAEQVEGLMILLGYYIRAYNSYRGRSPLEKNRMEMLFYKSDLAEVVRRLPRKYQSLLKQKAAEITSLLLAKADERAEWTEEEKVRKSWVQGILEGKADHFATFIDSKKLGPEPVGPVGARGTAVVMEARKAAALLGKSPTNLTREQWEGAMDKVVDLLKELNKKRRHISMD